MWLNYNFLQPSLLWYIQVSASGVHGEIVTKQEGIQEFFQDPVSQNELFLPPPPHRILVLYFKVTAAFISSTAGSQIISWLLVSAHSNLPLTL